MMGPLVAQPFAVDNRAMERLTVLVAAGASQALGLPGTSAATERLVQFEAKLIKEGFETADAVPYPSIFQELLSLVATCYDQPNFEHLLHALESLATVVETAAHPRGASKAIELLFTNGLSDQARALAQVEYLPALAATFLYSELGDLFTEASERAPLSPQWGDYQEFWAQLSRYFLLDVATLNYDTCIEQAMPQLNHGFVAVDGCRPERFDARRLRELMAPRLMHLHGSVHFGGRELCPGDSAPPYQEWWDDVYYYPDLKEAAAARRGSASGPTSQAGRRSIIGPLITGLHKPDKFLFAEPYASYYRCFAECLESCPRLLVIGYGFGDRHINALLERVAVHHGAARRLACIDWTALVWPDAGYRHVPAWRYNSILPRWSGHPVELLSSGVVEKSPWVSKSGFCWLDVEGFLSRPTQLADLVEFLAS